MMLRGALRVMLLLLLSAALPEDGAAQVRDTPAAHVRGRVLDAGTQQPIAGTLVWLAGRTLHMARTDAAGAYTFASLEPGAYCLRIDTPGYDPARACISVSAGAALSVDLPLTMRPVAIDPLVVTGRRAADDRVAATLADSAGITPLTQQLDLIGAQNAHRAAATLGVLAQNARSDRSGGRRPHALYMWGSSAERGRVLLDGASLSAPLHLGALLPPVDPQVIESAAVHTAGVSPRYDGGTAYIMNFTTRPASDRARVWGELDLLAGRVGAETPINGHGRVLISARRVNDEVIGQLAPARFGYDYRDALARADLDLGSSGGVHVTAFTTDEAVSIPRDLNDDRAGWKNRAATVMWRRDGSAATSLTLSASRGVADLPLLTALGGHLEATLDRYGAVAERQWVRGSATWQLGAELEHHAFSRIASATHDPVSGEEGYVECTPTLPCSRAATTLASTFGEVLFSPARSISLSIGARTMFDTHSRSVHVLPRAALTWVPDARNSLTLSAGRFSQPFVRDRDGAEDDGSVAIAHAAHVEIEAAHRADRLLLRGAAFLRQHERIEPTGIARTIPGADLALEYSLPAGTVAVAWSVSGAYEDNAVSPVQHLASAGFHARRGRWTISTTAAYGSGLPLTSIVLDESAPEDLLLQPNTGMQPTRAAAPDTDPDYLRLDSWLGAEWRIRRDERDIVILPYLRIINAIGERESLFYFQESDDITRAPRALARVPAIPVVGIRWYF